MMNNAVYKVTIGILAIALVGVFFYRGIDRAEAPQNTNTNSATSTTTTVNDSATYRNSDYNFSIELPKTWKEYTIVEDEWSGDSIDNTGNVVQGTVTGPLISVRHPDWDYKSPRQDIPVMVFTLQQWNDMQIDKFHIGAAPINPTEIGRNKTYVFAIPARYNYSFLTGYEEVEQILRGDNFRAF